MTRRGSWKAVVLALFLVAAACGGDGDTAETTEAPATTAAATTVPAAPVDPTVMNCDPVAYDGAPATLSFTWWSGGGDSPSDQWVRDAFDCFEQRYAGSITLDVEFVPGQHDYVEKLTTEYGATGELPVIVTLKRDPTLAQLWIENDELVDLMPAFNADSEWSSIAIGESTALNTVDGALVAAPDTFQTAIGIFYNTEMFDNAGVTEFPTDWDGFFTALDAIQATGVAPLSIHTDDTAWSAMLLFEALMARTPEGQAFLDEAFPTNFDQPFIVDAATDVARMFEYGTADAVGSVYAVAANNFLSEQTAMMPNGPWMIGDFSDLEQTADGFADKVDVALYPGAVAVDDTGRQLGDWAVTKSHPQEVIDAAIELVKFMNSSEVVRQRVIRLGSTAPNLNLTADELASLDPLASKLIQLVQENNAPILPNYQGQWNSIIQNETLVQEMPQLVLGNITAEEFASLLSAAAIEGNP